MKLYRTKQAITHVSGEIGLDTKQAEARKHLLKQIGMEGIYLPTGALTFKAGEVIGLSLVTKALALCLEAIEEPKGKAK